MILFILVLLGAPIHKSHAGTPCTPGIPCTTYDITAQPNAGTNPSFNAWKSGGPPPSFLSQCDGNYMNQMIGHAFMSAQREVAMNAQIIRKPDSVLEYTCFDQFLGITGARAGILTETDIWEPGSGHTITLKTADETRTESFTFTNPNRANRLEVALGNLMLDTLRNYIRSNFPHRYLGGASSIDNSMNFSVVGGGSYNCAHMRAVWDLAKCNNFGADDNFLSFGQLVTGDPRQLPAACRGVAAPVLNAGAPPPMGGIGLATGYITALDTLGVMTKSETNPCPAPGTTGLITADQIRLSHNCDKAFTAFEVAEAYLQFYRDPTWALNNPIKAPLSNFSLTTCGHPIPTGLKVNTFYFAKFFDLIMPDLERPFNVPGAIGVDYEEKFCINPSCTYVPGAAICLPPLLMNF